MIIGGSSTDVNPGLYAHILQWLETLDIAQSTDEKCVALKARTLLQELDARN